MCRTQGQGEGETEGEGTEDEAEGLVGAAYVAMLLGWLACDIPANAKAIHLTLFTSSHRSLVPFSSLAATLDLFFTFQLHAGILDEYLCYVFFALFLFLFILFYSVYSFLFERD